MDDPSTALTHFMGVRFLSLDATSSLYASLGLIVRDSRALCHSLRTVASARRRRSREQVISDFAEVFGADCELLGKVIGPQQATKVCVWIQDIYDHESNPWALLLDCFQGAAMRWRLAGSDIFELSAPSRVYDNFRAAIQGYDRESLIRTYRHNLSDWDREMYDSVMEHTASDWSPFADQAELCVRMFQFQAFWIGLRTELASTEIDRIDRVLETKGMHASVRNLSTRLFIMD
jgi:hypothetical protein